MKNIFFIFFITSSLNFAQAGNLPDWFVGLADLSYEEILTEVDQSSDLEDSFRISCEADDATTIQDVTQNTCNKKFSENKQKCFQQFASSKKITSQKEMETLVDSYVNCIFELDDE